MALNKKDIRIQAKQFLDYFSKFKGSNLNDILQFWFESKGFNKETEKAIYYEVKKIISQRDI